MFVILLMEPLLFIYQLAQRIEWMNESHFISQCPIKMKLPFQTVAHYFGKVLTKCVVYTMLNGNYGNFYTKIGVHEKVATKTKSLSGDKSMPNISAVIKNKFHK